MTQHKNFQDPIELQHSLHQKYSSSHSYINAKKITSIIQQKRLPYVFAYEDIEYLVEDEENLKRYYRNVEYHSKLNTFKQYYFYHEECPRIFVKDIEMIYAKWQDRRRNLVYRKLKRMFQESSEDKSHNEDDDSIVTHPNLLFQISQYNPFSKKYYIRVQEKKNKEKERKKQEREKVKTKDQISRLRHDLSEMLGEIKDLSAISTLDSARIDNKPKIYQRKPNQHLNSHGSQENSNSKSSSIIKFSFKKNKDGPTIAIHKNSGTEIRQFSKQKAKNKKFSGDITPKRLPHPNGSNEKDSLEKYKSKSIFSTTAFRSLNHNEEHSVNPKRELLKINLQSRYGRVGSHNQKDIKQKSQQKRGIQQQKLKVGVIKTQSNQRLELKSYGSKMDLKQGSLRKLKTNQDDFGDFKLNLVQNNGKKMTSYQSHNSSKKNLQLHSNSKRPSFKIKEVHQEKSRKGLKL